MLTLRRLARDLGGLIVVISLLLLVSVLPPDTSLDEVRANGAIRACIPTTYPPLVTGNPDRPGIDIEILRAVADHIGVDLLLSPNDAIGRDFNPRNWAVNRGKCQVLAGGVVDSALTRSFLETGPPYAETGWSIVAPGPVGDVDGLTVGALTLISGLDRIGLSSYLRAREVVVRIVRNDQAFVDGLASGEMQAGVTEALLAGWLAAENGLWAAPLSGEFSRYNLVFGVWKGDLTLKRKIVQAFRQLESDGKLATILKRYGAVPIGSGAPLAVL